jgi:hypothetical protein
MKLCFMWFKKNADFRFFCQKYWGKAGDVQLTIVQVSDQT